MRRTLCKGILVIALAAVSACATGRAVKSGQDAAKRGDWDSAVVFYRQALGQDPGRVDVKIALERAMREASAAHLKRARELEEQDQLPGAAAEYRLASDLDPTNAISLAKALQIERAIRDQIEASRPKSRIDTLREQAQQTAPIQRLDPRVRVPLLRFGPTAIKDILQFISDATGINITYDQNIPNINNPYSINLTDAPLEEALNQILTANQLAYKVLKQNAIFIYQDNPNNRNKYEDVYIQNFYISNGDPTEIFQVLSTLVLQGPIVRPVIQPNKSARTIDVRATAPVMDIIAKVIDMNDKPVAEVLVDVEILEVDRKRAKQLGVDLANFAINMNFSPETVPVQGTATQFNLNSLAGGFRAADFYTTVPTANIRLLESDQKTKILAKTQLRGREGVALTMNLGTDIPIASTTYNAAGGINGNVIPTTITYRTVGVNLSMTPRVTFRDEVILDTLTIDKSGLGTTFDVQGSQTPSFVRRTAAVTLRLRDGESNMLAGLTSDEDTTTYRTLPGMSRVPGLRNIFGWQDSSHDQTDIVMIVTPHIIRGHELTADDLKPVWVGSTSNIGGGTPPALISPGAPPPSTTVPLTGQLPAGPPALGTGAVQNPPQPPVTPPPTGGQTPPTTGAGGPPRPIGVVPVTPVTSGAPVTPPPSGQPQFSVGVGTTEFTTTGGPYSVPIMATNVSGLAAASITVEYNPAVLKATVVNQGTFMQVQGTRATFGPSIDNTKGRIDIALATNERTGVTGSGPLAAIMFEVIAPGTSPITISGTAATSTGTIQVTWTPASITVRR